MTSSKPKVRWGVIGCGQIAFDKAMPGIANTPNAAIVALTDPDIQRLGRASTAWPDAHAHDSTEALLADSNVDAVYIATPNFTHAALTAQAAAAHKHIMVEKPMAMTLAEGKDMVAACDRAGVKLMVAYMALFNPAYRMAKLIVDEGKLGEVVFVRGRHSYVIRPDRISSAAAWRLDRGSGGGPLLDILLYPAITVRHLTGQPIRRVSAVGVTRQLGGHTSTWDSVVVSFVMADDTPGVLEATFTHGSSLIELEGTNGRLALDGHISQGPTGRLDVRLRGERLSYENDPAVLSHFLPYQNEFEHFSACIQNGEEPIAAGRDVLHEMALADAVRTSIETGHAVDVCS